MPGQQKTWTTEMFLHCKRTPRLNLCADKRNLASKCLLVVSTTFLSKSHKLVHALQEMHRLFYSAVRLSVMRISSGLPP